MRQPLEEGRIAVSRAARSVVFPARFMLVAAMNPCPCGYRGHPTRACRCTPEQIARYASRVSGPLRDRIDLIVEVEAVPIRDLADHGGAESSRSVRARVLAARDRQAWRHPAGRPRSRAAPRVPTNALLHGRDLHDACALDADGRALLERSAERLGLSARGYHRVLRVARTVADLDGSPSVGAHHLAEALQYRDLDRRPGADLA